MSTVSNESIQSYINSLDKTDLFYKRAFGAFSVNQKQKTTLIGIAHLILIDDRNKVAEVALSVDARYRRQGVGTALINQAVTYTEEVNYSTLMMHCSNSNTPMISLARASGFHMKSEALSDLEGSLTLKSIDMNSFEG